ncbi:MAG TPA: ABC transporter ATP-binding protein [Thermomicrobiales bacterium]|nr:ABC transporter ATP-binding protein [Thermomicrobiales bacterium]
MESLAAKLDIRDLVVSYPLGRTTVTAIDRVSLSIPAGQFCAIVGPSGCGKSTLLRAVSGLVRPTDGTISIARETDDKPLQAMVFQGRSVFPWMTVLENAAYGLAMRGAGRQEREAIAERLLRQVGLGEFVQAYPAQLSEGMRQRVAIVRAFAVDPELLLMDEPFGALDEQTRLILQSELLRIWEATGKTVVFVTHSIDEAMILADRIIVLSARPGTIKADITVPFERPRTVEAVRSAPEFASLFLRIWALLRDEAAAPVRAAAS